MNQEKLISVTLGFRKEADDTWSIRTTKEDNGDDGFEPITDLPVDVLEVIINMGAPAEFPPELKKALIDVLEGKELAAMRKAEETEAFIHQAKEAGYTVRVIEDKEE